MWTGYYSYENDENAKIIIMLRENKKQKKQKKKWQAWLEFLKSSTCYIFLQNFTNRDLSEGNRGKVTGGESDRKQILCR